MTYNEFKKENWEGSIFLCPNELARKAMEFVKKFIYDKYWWSRTMKTIIEDKQLPKLVFNWIKLR